METLSFWKKPIYSAMVFFGTVVVLTLVYAGVTNVFYPDLPGVSSGSGLTAASWNNLVNYANKAVKQDTETLTVTGGKVGIGTVSPGAALEVNGNIKITDGTQGVGKVLASDSNGSANWQASNSIYYTSPTYTITSTYNSADGWLIISGLPNNDLPVMVNSGGRYKIRTWKNGVGYATVTTDAQTDDNPIYNRIYMHSIYYSVLPDRIQYYFMY